MNLKSFVRLLYIISLLNILKCDQINVENDQQHVNNNDNDNHNQKKFLDLKSYPKTSIKENDENKILRWTLKEEGNYFLQNKLEQCLIKSSSNDEINDNSSSCTMRRNNDDKNNNIFSNIFVITKELEFSEFLRKGSLQLLIFYSTDFYLELPEPGRKNFAKFLYNYNKGSKHLSQYDIYLGLVNCSSSHLEFEWCSSEDKIGRFAFGFQNSEERIGFPVETLFSVDSVVSSALHLSLLNSVPIIQTISEREELTSRCHEDCDVILSYHRSLGTPEHRLFLESAIKYRQKNLIFSLTTYSSGIFGLPDISLKNMDESPDPTVYILHCTKGKSSAPIPTPPSSDHGNNCNLISHYYGKFIEKEYYEFLEAYKLPLYSELSRKNRVKTSKITKTKTSDCLSTNLKSTFDSPYNNLSIPWAIFLFDHFSKERVYELIEPLARLLRGTVAVLTMNIEELRGDVEKVLSVKANDLKMPAILYVHYPNERRKCHFINDFDTPHKWILNQFLREKEREEHEENKREKEREEKKEKEREEQEENKREKEREDEEEEEERKGFQGIEGILDDFYDVEDLLQDDEVVLEMVPEAEFEAVPPVEGEEHFRFLLRPTDKIIAIAFYYSWDPVSNIMLQHLVETSKYLQNETLDWEKESAEQRKKPADIELYRVNCYDWPQICGQFNDTSPYLKVLVNGTQNITYKGAIKSDAIANFLLTLDCIILRNNNYTDVDLDEYLVRGYNCSVSDKLQTYIAGIFENEQDAGNFAKYMETIFGHQMVQKIIGKQFVSNKCVSKKGCVVISKPSDKFQPCVVLEASDRGSAPANPDSRFSVDVERTEELSTYIRHFSQPVLSPLTPELFEVANSQSIKVNGLLFIYFCSSAPELGGGNFRSSQSGTFELVGGVAANASRIGVTFSYIQRGSSIEQELRKAYRLQENDGYIVGVNRHTGVVAKMDLDNHSSLTKIFEWVNDVIDGKVKFTITLGDREWGPGRKSFPFLQFIEKDLIAEADDHLRTDLEYMFDTDRKSESRIEL